MKTYNLSEHNCPNCGNLMDCATVLPGQEQRHPEVGDITICLYCAQIFTFQEVDGRVVPQPPLQEHLSTLDAEHWATINKAIESIKNIKGISA